MLRFLLSRRALGLTAGLIVIGAAFAFLAAWQWDRAHSRVVDPISRPTVALDELSTPGTAAVPGGVVARSVRAAGTYDGQRTYAVLVSGSGVPTTWSMTPLRLGDGSVIPVVHGQVGSVAAARAVEVPRGQVIVTGRLQPSQEAGAVDAAAEAPAAGVLDGLSTSEVAGLVDAEIRPGFIAAAAEVPATKGVKPVQANDLVVPPRGIRIQNLLYTVQWSLFAAFALFVYWRLMRDAWRDASTGSPSAPDGEVAHEGPSARLSSDTAAKEATA